MHILVVRIFGSYIDDDVIMKLRQMGHSVEEKDFSKLRTDKTYENEKLESAISDYLSKVKGDVVYSSNFFPILGRVCSRYNMPYIAWHYDTPPNLPTEEDMDYPTNHIFFFNKRDYEHYKDLGLDTVYYLPLAVNADRIAKVIRKDTCYEADVALVGQLYNSTFPGLRNEMSEYDKGYFNGILTAQQELYGIYLPDELLDDTVMDRINTTFLEKGCVTKPVSKRQMAYSIATYLTYFDRMSLLNLLSERYKTRLYTERTEEKDRKLLKNVDIKGPVDYVSQMPLVFYNTKINLCPVLRNNTEGIPLRALDVMGCRGFLMANFHPGLAEEFADGEELVMYHSIEEAIELADYYIRHEDERIRIIEKGFERIIRDYDYVERLKKMITTVSI